MDKNYEQPSDSLWGEIQHCDEIYPGMFQVDTASHGGIMVHNDAMGELSTAAQKVGERYLDFVCYEEDCDAAVVFRELMDKPGWPMPSSYLITREKYEVVINRSLETWNKEYLAARASAQGPETKALEQKGLPLSCFSVLPSSGGIIFIERGGKGYTQLDRLSDDPVEVRAFVDNGNKALGVTRAQEEAMLAGSMFGWDVPGADPKNYNRGGVPVKPKSKADMER